MAALKKFFFFKFQKVLSKKFDLFLGENQLCGLKQKCGPLGRIILIVQYFKIRHQDPVHIRTTSVANQQSYLSKWHNLLNQYDNIYNSTWDVWERATKYQPRWLKKFMFQIDYESANVWIILIKCKHFVAIICEN
jgi:hypothetical protein